MTTIKACTADDYLASYCRRECDKGVLDCIPATADEMKAKIRSLCACKFPPSLEVGFRWEIRLIDKQRDLENLWTHKDGDWLERHGLWHDTGECGITLEGRRLPRQSLRVYADKAAETGFFENGDYHKTAQWRNYHNWQGRSLAGILADHNRPMLVQREGYIDILDGFGRLLPYLVLIDGGHAFVPFEAYYAIERSPDE